MPCWKSACGLQAQQWRVARLSWHPLNVPWPHWHDSARGCLPDREHHLPTAHAWSPGRTRRSARGGTAPLPTWRPPPAGSCWPCCGGVCRCPPAAAARSWRRPPCIEPTQLLQLQEFVSAAIKRPRRAVLLCPNWTQVQHIAATISARHFEENMGAKAVDRCSQGKNWCAPPTGNSWQTRRGLVVFGCHPCSLR
jgi:hypothetical protein